jgi:hypothetical protein
MIVTSQEYWEDKKNFFKKHEDADWQVETSPMEENGLYFKNYSFSDGAMWCERMELKKYHKCVEINKTTVTVAIDLQEIKYWSTEAPSKYYYEQYKALRG